MRNLLTLVWVLVVPIGGLNADLTDVRITEVWAGLSGGRPDGTHDWIEITNLGDTPIDTGDLYYDDQNPNIQNANQLQSLTLGPGETAIILLDVIGDNPMFDTSIGEFLSVWPTVNPFLVANAGSAAKLSTDGDSANLLLETGQLIDTFAYTSSQADTFMTIERIGDGSTQVRRSVLGENSTFESEMYFDEDTGEIALDANGDPIILVGSPGVYMIDLPGDVNCDGVVDLLDVNPFVNVITSGVFNHKADVNNDGSVNLLDVGEFITLLTEG